MSRPSCNRFLRTDRRAVAAVEFALVCGPFAIFLLAVMGAGLQFYVQQVLDYATQQAVRQVQIGRVTGYTQADFVNNIFCPVFGQFQACANLFVDMHPVADYGTLALPGIPDAPDSTATSGFVFCSGKPGQLMYAHVVYLAPSIGGALLGARSTKPMVANAAFANENPTGAPVPPGSGC